MRKEEQSFTQDLAVGVLAWFLSIVFSGTEYRTVLMDTLKTLHSPIKRKLGLRNFDRVLNLVVVFDVDDVLVEALG